METDPRDLAFPGVTLTATGMEAHAPSFEQWEAVGHFLQRAEGSILFWVGDWILHGESRDDWGDRYEDAIARFGLEYQTIANIKSVAQRIDISRRRENLTWTHHAEVAYLDPDEADAILDEAEPDQPGDPPKLTTREVRKRAKGDDVDSVDTVAEDTAKALRLLASLIETLARLGIDADEHTAAIRGRLCDD